MLPPRLPLISVLLFAIAVFTLYLAVALQSESLRNKRITLQAFYVGSALWSIAYGFQLAQHTVPGHVFWENIQYIAVGIIPVSWLLFTGLYTGRIQRLKPGYIAVLAIPPLISTVLAFTNPMGLVRGEVVLQATSTFFYAVQERGTWFYTTALYSYTLMGLGIWFLVDFGRGRTGPYRAQAGILALAGLAPTLGSILWVATPILVDPTPFAFFISGIALYVAVVRYQLGEVVPIARRRVMDHVDDIIVVLDDQDIIVDVNEAASAVLGSDPESAIGKPLDEVLPTVAAARPADEPADIELGGRHYDFNVSELSRPDENVGSALIFRDVTTRTEYERTIEHKNEQLEHMLSILSHDLQNPLQIGTGQLDLARERGEYERLDAVADSLDRIEAIIEDTLDWAAQGGSVESVEPVELESIATECWANVVTERAALTVESDAIIRADRSRLRHLFENLFRNSVDHGLPEDITADGGGAESISVEVGVLDEGGFYVEDDGVGIPAEHRESVFETGFSTRREGTGFGLSIVSQVVGAHGWEIDLEESARGGARFEITDVDVVS